MATKAIFSQTGFEPEGDLTFRVYLHIWAVDNVAVNVLNTTYFSPTDTSAAINMSLEAFVKQYTIDNWSVSYGMMDNVKFLNPVSLI